jgi:hypothetical protein
MVGWLVPIAALGLLLLPVQARAGEDDDVLKAMEAAKPAFTLTKAIQAAETKSKGKAVAAHAKMKGSEAEVLVFCEVGGKCMEVPVNVKTGEAGKMTEASAKEEKGEQITKAKEIAKLLDDGKQTLDKLIGAAETHAKGGKAISVTPKLNGAKLEFTVKVKAGDKWERVVLDGKTGKLKSEEAKSEKKPTTPAPGGKGGAPGGKGGAPGGKGGVPGGKGGARP